VASPERPLTANEIETDPAILRDPSARQKRRNRSGQGGGRSKAYMTEAVSLRSVAMQESPAYRVMSLSAHRVLDRLEIEFAKHGFKPEENGLLPCTYEDFVEYGIHRHAIAPAIRELKALGIARPTRNGSAGNEAHRRPTLFLICCRAAGSDKKTEDGWKRIKSIDEAEAIAKAAREGKADRRASEFGRRGAKARWAKEEHPPVMESAPTKNESPVMENAPTRSDGKGTEPSDGKRTEEGVSPVMVSIPLTNIFPGRGLQPANDARADTGSARPNPAPHVSWSPPRLWELDPVSFEPIGSWSPLPSNAQRSGSASGTVGVSASHAPTSTIVH
jgi:hypothetical protein